MRIGSMVRQLRNHMRAFPKARSGNVAMIFGLSLIPLCLAAGVGLDMSRAMITRARMGAALDAAGLAIGSKPGMSNDEMTALANQYFKQNYTADPNVYGQPAQVVVNRPAGSQTITLTTNVAMPTTLMRIAGLDTMGVNVSSQITWGQTKLWVALVLDNTGSMCEPPNGASFPCPNPASTTKIYALQQATHNLLTMLKDAAANNGDVLVSIVPFSKDVTVGTSYVGESWIDWTDWEAEPPNVTIASSIGPGSSCPFTDSSNRRKSPYGYYCMNDSTSDLGDASTATKVSKVPASGLICPGVDNGSYNTPGNGGFARAGHYWNGCYDSVPTNTLVTTSTSTSSNNSVASCTSNSNGNGVCSGSTSTSTNTSTTGPNVTTATTSGYSGDSGPTTTSSTAAPVTGSPSTKCTTKNRKTTCTTTVTTSTTTTTTSVTSTGAAPYNHNWVANSHSNWRGCIMDRAQDYDTQNVAPTGGAKFPAENSDNCPPGIVSPLPKASDVADKTAWDAYWSNLSTEVDAMVANGNTNQGVGLAWGWQTLTNAVPYSPGTLPTDTRKVLILLTDGANTQNRWSTSATDIDSRTKKTCQAIKDDNITVYTVLVMAGSSSMLQGCASDTTKYFELSKPDDIVTTFAQIGTQITNLRVSL